MATQRLFRLVLALAMLHLSVPAVATCASTHASTSHGSAMASMPDGHARGEHAASAGCESRRATRCCEDMAGCEVLVLPAARARRAHTVPQASRVRDVSDVAPASFWVSPEPPPPRA